MRNLVYLPIALIKAADNERWERSLAYFIKLKSLHKNNTHYGFTLRSLAVKVKCSPACLSHHLKVLESKGLITYHAGNITFAGLKKLQAKYNNNNFPVPVDFKNQTDILRGQIIRFNLSAQEHNIRKSGIQIRKTKSVPYTKSEKMESCYAGLSAAGIGNLFDLSAASGGRIREKLKNLGYLSVKRVFSILFKGISEKEYRNMKWNGVIPIYSFWKGGNIAVERRTELRWLLGNVSCSQKIN